MESEINKKGKRATTKCANCFVCRADTEFCPKSDLYDPDAYLQLEEKLLQRRKAKKKETDNQSKGED